MRYKVKTLKKPLFNNSRNSTLIRLWELGDKRGGQTSNIVSKPSQSDQSKTQETGITGLVGRTIGYVIG